MVAGGILTEHTRLANAWWASSLNANFTWCILCTQNRSKRVRNPPPSFFSSCAKHLWDICQPYFDINKHCFLRVTLLNKSPHKSWQADQYKLLRVVIRDMEEIVERKVWKLFDLQETRERWAPRHDLTCMVKCLDKAHHETFVTGPLASVSTIWMLLTTCCLFFPPKRGIMQKVWSSASHQDGFFSPAGKFFT